MSSKTVGENRFIGVAKRVSPPFNRSKAPEYERMFDLFETKADIQVLDSAEDDMLAASIYGGVKTSKPKNSSKKMKKRTSGYDFDSLIKD